MESPKEFSEFILKILLRAGSLNGVLQCKDTFANHDHVVLNNQALVGSELFPIQRHSLSSFIIGNEKEPAGSFDPVETGMDSCNSIIIVICREKKIYTPVRQ